MGNCRTQGVRFDAHCAGHLHARNGDADIALALHRITGAAIGFLHGQHGDLAVAQLCANAGRTDGGTHMVGRHADLFFSASDLSIDQEIAFQRGQARNVKVDVAHQLHVARGIKLSRHAARQAQQIQAVERHIAGDLAAACAIGIQVQHARAVVDGKTGTRNRKAQGHIVGANFPVVATACGHCALHIKVALEVGAGYGQATLHAQVEFSRSSTQGHAATRCQLN